MHPAGGRKIATDEHRLTQIKNIKTNIDKPVVTGTTRLL
jgi:hypothetical protein